MRTLGTTLIVNRGETFSLTRKAFNFDGTPIILSNNLINPYLVITVSSTNYPQEGKYVKKIWYSLSEYSKFASTEPYLVIQIDTPPDGDVAYQRVYYIVDDDGEKQYYYYDGTSMLEYYFEFTVQFLNDYTKDWVEQEYSYSVVLCDGTRMYDFLLGIYVNLYPTEVPPTNNTQLYLEICKTNPDLVKNVNYTSPLSSFSMFKILLNPSRLLVYSNKSNPGGYQ